MPWCRFSAGTSAASSKSSGRMPTITSRPTLALASSCRSWPAIGMSPSAVRSLPSSSAPRHEVHGRRADEPGHEQVDRPVVELLRRCHLLQHAAAHDGHPVAEGQRLGLVVRHVDHGGAQPLLQPGHLGAGLHPELGVQVGQRLVHQERGRVADDGPAHGHPLPLAAGQVGRLAVQVLGQVQDPRRLLDLLVDDVLGRLGQLEREPHVLPHGHVRVQGVALEHHRDVAVLGRLVVDDLPADAQLARR